MNYRNIITKVAKTFDPEQTINVTIIKNEDLGEAHFVVAFIEYPERDMCIPFIIYNDGAIYMPNDWEGELPITAVDIDHTKRVSFTDGRPLFIINGLPRVF